MVAESIEQVLLVPTWLVWLHRAIWLAAPAWLGSPRCCQSQHQSITYVCLCCRMHSTKQRSEGLRAPRAVKLATCEGRVEQLALKGYNYYANEYTALSRPTHASAEAGSSHTGSGDADGGASSDGAVLTCSKDIAKMFVVRQVLGGRLQIAA